MYIKIQDSCNDGSKKDTQEETEEERMIRLGEMTPFGSNLKKKTSVEMTELDKYFKRQQELGIGQPRKKKKKGQSESQSKTEKTISPLKRNILMPKKRQKKLKLGTKTSKNSK
jgi:hypothetical protein